MDERGSITSQWLRRHNALYQAATRHPFILTIADGSINFQCFKRWLGQDYHFVKAFVRFLASLLPKMPKEATDEEMDTLLGGIVALRDEIYWFRSEAMRWTIQLDLVSIKVTTQEYCEFLEQLSQGNFEYAIAVTALWAIEFVYYESFALCTQSNAKTPTELREACERWSNMEFKNYCVLLKGLADKYLEGSNLHVRQKAEEIFVQILKQEIKFWDMSTCDENCI
ncbi:hypothetical protein O6H91_02G018100 [Diphasiastrum complanatum]|uniref:Uncharacterized protein n=1 Tax=Diphasiastrum complanatum TaxID=34168 RepID=A0ACC2EDH7_DIPCM|nr:hypothetical protein O6H91_Y574700 [Diphasiastrum complanatum]KAJ7564455.1 hypothetical protein O6H91_02G018100 [Diphasiastrum complanatum]